jgi:uncharacterized protein YjbI with pentapeptide repeats
MFGRLCTGLEPDMLRAQSRDQRKVLTQGDLNAILMAGTRAFGGARNGSRVQLSRTKLDGLDLSNRNLTEADMSEASLISAVAFGSDFTRANLHCADLRDCDLSNTKLVRAEMRGAMVCGANLEFATLDGADLRATTVAYRGPGAAAREKEGETSVSVDFSNASLKGASLGHAQLDGASFAGALLQGANFKNARLTNVSFRNAVLTGVNLADLDVPPEALEGAITDVSEEVVVRAKTIALMLDAHQLCITSGGRKGARAVLDNEDLRPIANLLMGRPLTGLSARRVLGIGLDFSGCQLQGARFDGADLRECDFSHADLRGASFRHAKLAHANFDHADLNSLRLADGSDLAPDFTGATATKSRLFSSILDDNVAALSLQMSHSR